MERVTKKNFKTQAEVNLFTDFHKKLGHTTLVKQTAKQFTVTVIRASF